MFTQSLFPGYLLKGSGAFRVIRDSDLEIEEEAEDLVRLFRIGAEAASPRLGDPARIRQPHAARAARFRCRGDRRGRRRDLRAGRHAGPERALRDRLARPARAEVQALQSALSRARARQRRRLLPRHPPEGPRRPPPYESFDVVVQYLKQAARDPNVVAIKQTLYRTSSDSPIVGALIEAAEAGKSVTASGRAQGALRRGGQHPLVARSRARRRTGRVRLHRAEDPRQAVDGGAARGHATSSPTATSAPAIIIPTRRRSTRTSRSSRPTRRSDATSSRVFNFITGYAEPGDLERLAMSPVRCASASSRTSRRRSPSPRPARRARSG